MRAAATPYRSLVALTRITVAVFVTRVFVEVTLGLTWVPELRELFSTGPGESLRNAADRTSGPLGLVASVCLLAWMFLAARNLRALGREGLRYSPSACVGWWFVPFANFVVPMRAMNEIFCASVPEDDSARWGGRVTWVTLWWASWFAISLTNIAGRLAKDAPALLARLYVARGLFFILAGYFVLRVLLDVSRLQHEETLARLSASEGHATGASAQRMEEAPARAVDETYNPYAPPRE